MNRVAAVFNTFDDAMNAHKAIFTLLIEQGYVTYGDFTDIVYNSKSYIHVTKPSVEIFTKDYYDLQGWTYLCGTTVEEYKKNKFIIVMPEMIDFGIKKNRKR